MEITDYKVYHLAIDIRDAGRQEESIRAEIKANLEKFYKAGVDKGCFPDDPHYVRVLLSSYLIIDCKNTKDVLDNVLDGISDVRKAKIDFVLSSLDVHSKLTICDKNLSETKEGELPPTSILKLWKEFIIGEE